MRRDPDLIRIILLRVEASSPGELREQQLAIDGVDPVALGYHVELLEEAGFIDATLIPTQQTPVPVFVIHRLTWQGHELLDNIRDSKVWEKTKSTIGEKLASAGMDLVAKVAAEIVKARLGIA